MGYRFHVEEEGQSTRHSDNRWRGGEGGGNPSAKAERTDHKDDTARGPPDAGIPADGEEWVEGEVGGAGGWTEVPGGPSTSRSCACWRYRGPGEAGEDKLCPFKPVEHASGRRRASSSE